MTAQSPRPAPVPSHAHEGPAAHDPRPAVLDADALDALARRVAELVALTPFPPLVDAEQAARLLGVPASWVLAEARANRIPHVCLGKYRRFDPEALREWWLTRARGPVAGSRPVSNARRAA